MTLTALGTGSAFSRLYGTTCSMLSLSSGERWLIDCGRQAPNQLHRVGLSWWDIAGQIVTHVHGDHTFGLEDFAFMRYYGGPNLGPSILSGGPKPRLIAHSAVRDEIWEFLNPSLRYRTDASGKAVAGTLEDYFEVVPAKASEAPRTDVWNHAESFGTNGLSLVTRETRHVPGKPSMSLEISLGSRDSGGSKDSGDSKDSGSSKDEAIAWWSGDSIVDHDRLLAVSKRATVMFHDCTFVDQPGQVHGTFSELRKLPASVREKVVLMHHDDDLEQHRQKALDLGFRVLLPGDVYDLSSGKLRAPVKSASSQA